MTTVAIVAPAPAVRAGLTALLRADESVAVVADAATVTDLEVDLADVDVLLLTPDGATRIDLEDVLGETARCAVLLLTEDPDTRRMLAGLPLRAWGLLSLDASPEELIAAIAALREGLIAGAPILMQPLLDPRRTTYEDVDEEPLEEPLTEREVEVLQLVAQGRANRQIADELFISEHTVKFHVSSIYGKLGATNRAEAVSIGIRRGLIPI